MDERERNYIGVEDRSQMVEQQIEDLLEQMREEKLKESKCDSK